MYDFSKSNWAEDEIIRLGNEFGAGEYIKFISLDDCGNQTVQTKKYGKYIVAYPDVENRENGKLLLLIEVKSRHDFYFNNKFLGLKVSSFNSYDIVQKNEGKTVKIVYLIGDKNSYDVFWCKVNEIKSMEKSFENFQDMNDKKVSPYMFFHSSQLHKDVRGIFTYD